MLAATAAEHRVDGGVLLELTSEGWREMGVTSAVEQARLTAAVKKASRGTAHTWRSPTTTPTAAAADSKSGTTYENGSNATDLPKTERALLDLIISKTPDAGAEHTKDWVPAVANANADGDVVKDHTVRFLSMYNGKIGTSNEGGSKRRP